jgi:hypothetical protein
MSTPTTFAEARDELIARGNRIQKLRGTPRDQALIQAMSERPDLAVIVDGRDYDGRPLPAATASTAAPASPHQALLSMAETIRKAEPALSEAQAYLRATKERPDLLTDAIAERPPRLPVDTYAEQQRRLLATFTESPAGKAHAQLEAFAEQIRLRPGLYKLSAEQAYLEATREHADLFAEAVFGMEGQKVLTNPERPVKQGGASSVGQLNRADQRNPAKDLASSRDVLSRPRTWPNPSPPTGPDDPLHDEWLRLASRPGVQKVGETMDQTVARLRRQAGVKD